MLSFFFLGPGITNSGQKPKCHVGTLVQLQLQQSFLDASCWHFISAIPKGRTMPFQWLRQVRQHVHLLYSSTARAWIQQAIETRQRVTYMVVFIHHKLNEVQLWVSQVEHISLLLLTDQEHNADNVNSSPKRTIFTEQYWKAGHLQPGPFTTCHLNINTISTDIMYVWRYKQHVHTCQHTNNTSVAEAYL